MTAKATAVETPAVVAETVTPVNPLDPKGAILAAKEAVPAGIADRTRALRDAAVKAAGAAYGPITIVGPYVVPRTGVKFSAWITGARGFTGVEVKTADGTRYVTGETTVADMIRNGHVANPTAIKPKTAPAVVKGILS